MSEINVKDAAVTCDSGRWKCTSDAVSDVILMDVLDQFDRKGNMQNVKDLVDAVISRNDASKAVILSQALVGKVTQETHKLNNEPDMDEKNAINENITTINRLIMKLVNVAGNVFSKKGDNNARK